MGTKSILLAVADPQALVDITQALGAGWEATSAASEAEALAQLDNFSFDALVVDFNLGDPDASALLNQAMEKRPQTVAFLLAYEADLALVAAKVLGTPQILPKPVDPDGLKSRLESSFNESNPEPTESAAAASTGDSPTIPPVYAEVLKAIESLGVTDAEVGEIIGSDPALTAELLRLTNSSYLGLPRNISDPIQAVELLGFETVKALVMALQFLAQHSRLKPGYLSLDQIWRHSVNVAQIARDLVLFETKDRNLANQALTAGLLHDLGKIVLVTNFDDLYGRVHSLARKQPVALWDIEKEMFGANHGEIGGCLVGMWNMPTTIVEATALHHEPPLGEQQQLTPLAAVHIANVLERELCPGTEERMVPPIINTTFLNDIGLLQRLPVWRAAFANRRAEDIEADAEPAEKSQPGSTAFRTSSTSRTANQLASPAGPTRTTTSGQPQRVGATPQANRYHRNLILASVAAVLVLAALWINTRPQLDEVEPVYARMPAPKQAPAVVASVTEPATAPAQSTEAAPPVEVSQEPAPAPPSEPAKPKPSVPSPESPASPTPEATATAAPPASTPPAEKAQPEFRLNGIIYASVSPSAIVNGKTVNVGDQVNGATVVGIGRTSVTLQINGKRKTYELQ